MLRPAHTNRHPSVALPRSYLESPTIVRLCGALPLATVEPHHASRSNPSIDLTWRNRYVDGEWQAADIGTSLNRKRRVPVLDTSQCTHSNVKPERVSEWFFERAQIHLVRPCRALLAMDIPIGVSNGIDAKQAVLATVRRQARHSAEQPVAVDPAINNYMGNVDAKRPVFPAAPPRGQLESRQSSRPARNPQIATRSTP
jgi:hypothetical protein